MRFEVESADNELHIVDGDILLRHSCWHTLVGLFILNFGHLEMLIFSYLEKHLSAEEFDLTKRLHFKDLLAEVSKLMAAGARPHCEADELKVLEKEIEKVRDLRNHIAHGHLTVNIPEGNEGRMILCLPRDIDRPFDPGTRQLQLSELRDALESLNKFSEEFRRLSNLDDPSSDPSQNGSH